MDKNCSLPSQRGNDSSDDILPKGDLTVRPNSPSNLNGPLQAWNISWHYCGDILRTKPQHVWTDGFCLFFCVFLSLLPDLVGLIPVRQLIQTKLAICLITDCCHDYGKQGGNGAFSFCLWTNTSSRKEQFNINQVEWSTDPIGYTEGEPKCKHTSEKDSERWDEKNGRRRASMYGQQGQCKCSLSWINSWRRISRQTNSRSDI